MNLMLGEENNPQNREFYTSKVIPALKSYIKVHYFKRGSSPKIILQVMNALVPGEPSSKQVVDLGNVGWRQLSNLSSINIVGCLSRKRLIITCGIRVDLGFKYSAFESILGYPKILLEDERDHQEEDSGMFETKKFKPVSVYLMASRLSDQSQRKNEVNLFNNLALASIIGKTVLVHDTYIPPLISFKSHEAAKTICSNRFYFLVASVSSDSFFISLQVFRAHSKKLVFRRHIVIQDVGVSRIMSIELEDTTVHFLISYMSINHYFTYDLKKRKIALLTDLKTGNEEIFPIKTARDRIFIVKNPFTCQVMVPDVQSGNGRVIREITISSIGSLGVT